MGQKAMSRYWYGLGEWQHHNVNWAQEFKVWVDVVTGKAAHVVPLVDAAATFYLIFDDLQYHLQPPCRSPTIIPNSVPMPAKSLSLQL